MSIQRTCLSSVLACVTEVLISNSYMLSAEILGGVKKKKLMYLSFTKNDNEIFFFCKRRCPALLKPFFSLFTLFNSVVKLLI